VILVDWTLGIDIILVYLELDKLYLESINILVTDLLFV
jgi:hypothetical protein